jgi:subtilase family serine protease
MGNPNDGVRDLPDISLFASDGFFWSHTYIFCFTDPNGGSPCDGNPIGWSESGGTSFSAPLMAGIQALVNQKTGSRQGLPNYYYYKLASAEYGISGSSACNSNRGNAVGNSCIFYDITLGDITVPCYGTTNCFDSVVSFANRASDFPGASPTLSSSAPFPYPGAVFPAAALRGDHNPGTYGILTIANSASAPAYNATTGWDFATGIGSVNAFNLVNAWSTITAPTANRNRRLEIGFRK